MPDSAPDLVALIPAEVWTPAYDSSGATWPGAWVAELTGLLDLTGWPRGMRVVFHKERPHPGAQLRLTDADGQRLTVFATNPRVGGPGTQLPDLELRRRARAEDRIRCPKDTGLTNLPLHDFTHNQIWCVLVQLAGGLLAWAQLLALHGNAARRWEPKRLRLRLLSASGRLATSGRGVTLHLARTGPWTQLLLDNLHPLRALPAPASLDSDDLALVQGLRRAD